MTPSLDSIAGCILGGAIGDFLGAPAEGREPSLSDDTQLTLATLEALASTGRAEPAAIAAHFLSWYRRGALSGLGASTLKALRDLDVGAHWALSGTRGEHAAGNGAAMRIAPLAFVLDPNDVGARVTIRDICRITHHSDEAYLGALAVLLAIHGRDWLVADEAFANLGESLPDCRVRDRLLELAALDRSTPAQEVAIRFGSSGYVVETVPLALFLSRQLDDASFATVLTALAGFAKDADTIGSIAGQVAGAHLGREALPKHLLEHSALRQVAESVESWAPRLAQRSPSDSS